MMRAFVTLFLCIYVLSITAASQTRPIPRTADGQPDLQGIWSFATITPLERPPELAGKEFFATDKEAADYEADVRKRNNMDRRDGPAEQDVGRAYNDFWYDRGTKIAKTKRTSLIIDPRDGKIPPLTPAARERRGDDSRQIVDTSLMVPRTAAPGRTLRHLAIDRSANAAHGI